MIHHISIKDPSDTAGVGDTELLPSAPVPRGGYFGPPVTVSVALTDS